jgi:folate-dependent phosphoribosylglycinamide formyltransferase PurN
LKVLFLNSGNGGNFKFIDKLIKLSPENNIIKNIEILGSICDRDCGAYNYTKDLKLFSSIHSFKRNISEDLKLINLINNQEPDLVITNVHKIISKNVLSKVQSKFINIHYSLLPAFVGHIGMKSVDKAISNKCKFIGSTSHYVTESLDNGPIICQSSIAYTGQSNIYNEIFKTGALCLLSSILQNLVKTNNVFKFERIYVNPMIDFEYKLLNNAFNSVK